MSPTPTHPPSSLKDFCDFDVWPFEVEPGGEGNQSDSFKWGDVRQRV